MDGRTVQQWVKKAFVNLKVRLRMPNEAETCSYILVTGGPAVNNDASTSPIDEHALMCLAQATRRTPLASLEKGQDSHVAMNP